MLAYAQLVAPVSPWIVGAPLPVTPREVGKIRSARQSGPSDLGGVATVGISLRSASGHKILLWI
jgi:hypothetical protein